MLTPKQVELLFEDRVKLNGGLPIRFQDTKDANGSYLRTNPSDFVVAYENGSVYSEVKSFKGTRFPFSNIKSSQFAWAAQIHRLGQPYMFYLFHQTPEQADGKGVWFIVPAFVILNQAKEGIKSISLTDLEKYRND
mgnify:FL=1